VAAYLWFSTFVNRGSLHRRKSAACPKVDMVWLHRSSIPMGRRGNFLVQMISIPAMLNVEGVGGVRHPVGRGRLCFRKYCDYLQINIY
jgi:hypothetical protein